MAIYRGTGGTGDSTTDTTVTTVTEKAAEAASSATSAANSATSAANSASSASTSETNAATSATNAANSATASATSATNSASDANSASTSATNAANSAYNASVYRNETQTLKTQTESLKDTTILAATAASGHADDAETAYANTLAIYGSTTDVQNAVDSASTSATNAATSATQAATSATNAANSATSAGTSETNAASSASQAATSAASANSYATDAQTAQTAAETAQAAAEAAEYNINGLYLGSLANDPTLDGNGVAVTTGDLYFNTTEQEVRVYTDGDVWEPVVDLAGDITVNSLTSNNNVVVKGNLEVQGTTITVDSATAQTIDLGDNDKIRLGDDDDLQIYHTGTLSQIQDSGTGELRLSSNGAAVRLWDTANLQNLAVFNIGGKSGIYHNGTETLATTSTGVDVTGNITVSGTVDGRDIATDGATLDAVASTYVDVSGDTMTGDLAFGDNVKAKFGASDDLQIYHDGSNSRIREVGTGSLLLDADSLYLRNTSGDSYVQGINGGAVNIFYNGAVKLNTTSTGIDITGTVVADGLTVDGSTNAVTLQSPGTNTRYYITDGTIQGRLGIDGGVDVHSGSQTAHPYRLRTSGIKRQELASNGDISFYDDAGTSQDFYWDASTSRLGLGTTSPDKALVVSGVGAEIVINDTDTTDTPLLRFRESGSTSATIFTDGGNLIFTYGSTQAARIDSSGNLLVGTTANDVGSSSSVEGITLSSGSFGGYISAARSGGTVARLNRQTSDGQILDFRKDGTTVGSIGTFSNDAYIATNDTGLRFIDSVEAITPFNGTTVTNRDAAISLGLSSYRFTDLYLSGGVYLGGTGADNLLDDYEEGTWTPSFEASSGAATYGTQTGYYRKIGTTVFASFWIRGNKNTLSGDIRIENLPYQPSPNETTTTVSIGYAEDFNSDMPNLKGQVAFNHIRLYKGATNASSLTRVSDSDLSSASVNDNSIRGVAIYFTS